jgi:hypothetical protein
MKIRERNYDTEISQREIMVRKFLKEKLSYGNFSERNYETEISQREIMIRKFLREKL